MQRTKKDHCSDQSKEETEHVPAPPDISDDLVNKYVCSRSIKQYEVSLVILLFSAQQQCPFRGKEYKL